jgi:hypothetical protein
MPDVLPGGCHHHFTGEIDPGCGLVGVKMTAHVKKNKNQGKKDE